MRPHAGAGVVGRARGHPCQRAHHVRQHGPRPQLVQSRLVCWAAPAGLHQATGTQPEQAGGAAKVRRQLYGAVCLQRLSCGASLHGGAAAAAAAASVASSASGGRGSGRRWPANACQHDLADRDAEELGHVRSDLVQELLDSGAVAELALVDGVGQRIVRQLDRQAGRQRRWRRGRRRRRGWQWRRRRRGRRRRRCGRQRHQGRRHGGR